MSDRSGSQSEPVTGPPLFWRIRHAPATAMAAMALFLVLSCLWLVAAATAQVWYHSAPSNYVFASQRGLLRMGRFRRRRDGPDAFSSRPAVVADLLAPGARDPCRLPCGSGRGRPRPRDHGPFHDDCPVGLRELGRGRLRHSTAEHCSTGACRRPRVDVEPMGYDGATRAGPCETFTPFSVRSSSPRRDGRHLWSLRRLEPVRSNNAHCQHEPNCQ